MVPVEEKREVEVLEVNRCAYLQPVKDSKRVFVPGDLDLILNQQMNCNNTNNIRKTEGCEE